MRLGWLKWVLLLVVGIPVALVVAGYIILTTWDFDELRQIARDEVHKITGRDLRIEGPIDIAFSLTPAITLQDIRFANMPGGSAEEMAQIERLEVQVALLPLLRQQIEVHRFLLQDAEILLETNAEGQANWIFGEEQQTHAEEQVEEVAETQQQVKQQIPRLERVTIENSRLTWRNGETGEEMTIALAEVQLAELEDHLEIQAQGDYQGLDFATEGSLGTPQQLLTGTSFPIELSGHLAETRYSLAGALSGLQEQPGADFEISLQGDNLPALSRLAGRDLPDVGAYGIEGRITYAGDAATFQNVEAALGESRLQITGEASGLTSGAPVVHASIAGEGPALEQLAALAAVELQPLGAWSLQGQLDASSDRVAMTDLSLRLGENALGGQLQVALGGRRSGLSGRLEAEFLDLTALLPEGGEDSEANSRNGDGDDSPFLIPDTPLPLDALRIADAELELAIGRLRLPNELEFENIDLAIRLAAGDLSIQPRSLGFYDGNLAGEVNIDASQEPASLRTDLRLQGLDIGRLMRERGISDAMQGRLHANLDISARGNSPRAIASSLNGQSDLEVGEGIISNRLLAVIGSGLGEIMDPLFGGQDSTQLNCVLSRIDYQDGVAINRAAVIDASTFSVAGSGRIDLRDESLNLHFDTSSRVSALVSLAIPFNVRGTLKSPQFAPDPLGTAQRAAELAGIEISPPAALAAMIGMDQSQATSENPCAVALDAEAAAPAETVSPQQQLEELGRGLLEEGLSGGSSGEDDPAGEIGRRLRGLFGN